MTSKTRLMSLWENVWLSFWFIPTVLTVACSVLAFTLLEVDRWVQQTFTHGIPWLYTGSAEGARTLLGTISGSMIGLAGVVFSITTVTLVLASNQFGPRLLRNFIQDRGNQVVMGVFVAAFLYCLLVLRTIHGSDANSGDPFIPQVSMSMAVVLAVAGLAVLIYFIHHVSYSIQAPNVLAAVARDAHATVRQLFPNHIGQAPEEKRRADEDVARQIPQRFDQESTDICVQSSGYVRRMESEQLMRLAVERDLVVRVEHRPGQFVQANQAMLRAWPPHHVDGRTRQLLGGVFTIESQRSLTQDAEFSIEQMVEIGVRALSPGINDPFTAMLCADRLGEVLSDLASREIPSAYRVDERGRLRVIAQPMDLPKYVDAAFNQMRQHASRSLAVTLRLLKACTRLGANLRRDEDREYVAMHARMFYEQAAGIANTQHDHASVDAKYVAALGALRWPRDAEAHGHLRTH